MVKEVTSYIINDEIIKKGDFIEFNSNSETSEWKKGQVSSVHDSWFNVIVVNSGVCKITAKDIFDGKCTARKLNVISTEDELTKVKVTVELDIYPSLNEIAQAVIFKLLNTSSCIVDIKTGKGRNLQLGFMTVLEEDRFCLEALHKIDNKKLSQSTYPLLEDEVNDRKLNELIRKYKPLIEDLIIDNLRIVKHVYCDFGHVEVY